MQLESLFKTRIWYPFMDIIKLQIQGYNILGLIKECCEQILVVYAECYNNYKVLFKKLIFVSCRARILDSFYTLMSAPIDSRITYTCTYASITYNRREGKVTK